MRSIPSCKRHGFTLIEMAIVLVIIAILAGGVITAKTLIDQAQLRSIITEANNYRTAIQGFRDQYRYLPGDMPNAKNYWSSASLNGNGNGIVEYGTAANAASEAFAFWQELGLSGLIKGSYTGNAGPSYYCQSIAGTNIPYGKVKGTMWGPSYMDNSGGSSLYSFQRDYRNWFTFSGLAGDDWYADNLFLTTAEAQSIDSKMDDGKPGTGIVQETWEADGIGKNCTNATSITDFKTDYKLSNVATGQCGLLFKYP